VGLSDRIKEEDKMTERWTDERLDRFANKIDEQAERINTLIENIGQLVQSLYLEFPNIKAEINSISEEARETREVLSQMFKESNDRMTRIENTLDRQTAIADKQADSVRQLIEMLNRKQA
jgi:DNA-binding ferritin-like protein